jgi:YD repeat-containing protein
MAGMTLVEVSYELEQPLGAAQLRALGEFSNLYGLRRFRVDERGRQIRFEYDASRLTEIQVADALRKARIPVKQRA